MNTARPPLKCVCLATPISLLYVNTNHNISLLTSRTRVEGFLHTLCPYEIYNPKEEIEWLSTEEEHEPETCLVGSHAILVGSKAGRSYIL